MEITTKISKRSNGFFNALHNLQKLHSEVLAACQEIDTLRDAMAYMDEKTVKDALSIVQKNVRRQHLSTVMETIQQIKMVKTTLSTIDVLVESGDYFGAIEMIRAAQVNLDEELGGIHALNHYREKMKDYVAVIEDKLSLQFVEYAEGEGDLSEFDKMHLTPIIKELVTINKFQKTLQMYREHQQDLMKECVSQVRPRFLDSSIPLALALTPLFS
jgi:flagellar biosynthesis regulator FlbT